jgi:hypothetical protein
MLKSDSSCWKLITRNSLEHKAVPVPPPTLHAVHCRDFGGANGWAHRLKVYVPNGPIFKRLPGNQAGEDGAFAAAFLSEASFNSRDSFSTR